MSKHTPKIIAMLLLLALASGLVVTGATAQNGELFVTVTQVDSRAFPQVTAYIAASDQNGAPLTGLAAADLTVFEEGLETPSTLTAVESVDSLDLTLALVLDVSMPDEPLAEVKEAALALLGALRPGDSVALLVLYDEIRLLHDFSSDAGELQAAVKSLEGEGNYTTLYQVAFEAAAMTTKLPVGRKAVVILTNFRDNIGARSAESAIEYARLVGAPLYTIGFGPEFQSDPLQDMVKLTGGQSFCLSSPDEIPDTLQELARQLRRGYRVTFQSRLKADNAEHDFSLRVTRGGRAGQARGRFVALPGQVTVSLPGLAEGQTVSGVVNLAVQVTAPAPVASVEYRLNGHPLAKVTTPPYSFEWDSTTLAPGPYRLTVHVVDQSGSEGQAEVNLNVVRPIAVTAFISRNEVEIGAPVIVEARVETPAEVTRVEFLLDGELVGSDDTPPYRFSFDSQAYPVGEHLITVRAEDSLGREAETDLTVQFLAARPFWLRLAERLSKQQRSLVRVGMVATAIAVAGVLLLATLLALVLLLRAQKNRYRKKYYLEISNLGNVRSPYILRVEEPTGLLKFQLRLNDAPLPRREISEWPARRPAPGEAVLTPAPVGEERGPAEEATAAARPASFAPPQEKAATPAGGAQKKALPVKLSQTQKSAKGALSKGGAAAGVLGLLGNLLPGSLGAPLRSTSRSLRKGQQKASRVTRVPGQKIGTAKRIPSQMRKLVRPGTSGAGRQPETAKTTPAGATAGQPLVGSGQAAPPPVAEAGAPQVASEVSTPRPVSGGTVQRWAQTPPLEPGESLTLDLLIDPLKPYQTREYSFAIVSRPIEPELPPGIGPGAFARQEPLVEEGRVQIVAASRLGRFLSIVAATAVIVLEGLLATLLIFWLLQL